MGARLIAHAGSLLNLAKQPASTIQILGAEKVSSSTHSFLLTPCPALFLFSRLTCYMPVETPLHLHRLSGRFVLVTTQPPCHLCASCHCRPFFALSRRRAIHPSVFTPTTHLLASCARGCLQNCADIETLTITVILYRYGLIYHASLIGQTSQKVQLA